MEPVIKELVRYGWPGKVIAIMVLLARAVGEWASSVMPAWLSMQQKREDLLMEALTQATKVMTETASVLDW